RGLFVSGQPRYRRSVGAQFNLAVVVDDDPDIGLAARLALRDLFARVETLDSPAALLPMLKEETPDAILLDLNFERSATDGRADRRQRAHSRRERNGQGNRRSRDPSPIAPQ